MAVTAIQTGSLTSKPISEKRKNKLKELFKPQKQEAYRPSKAQCSPKSRWRDVPRDADGVVRIRKGKYTQEEEQILRTAVLDFFKERSLSYEDGLSFLFSGRTGNQAFQQIAACLPMRTVNSVYQYVRRRMRNLKRGRWTVDEEELCVRLIEEHGCRWTYVAEILNRRSEAVIDKMRELVAAGRHVKALRDRSSELSCRKGQKRKEGGGGVGGTDGVHVSEEGKAQCWLKEDAEQGRLSSLSGAVERKKVREVADRERERESNNSCIELTAAETVGRSEDGDTKTANGVRAGGPGIGRNEKPFGNPGEGEEAKLDNNSLPMDSNADGHAAFSTHEESEKNRKKRKRERRKNRQVRGGAQNDNGQQCPPSSAVADAQNAFKSLLPPQRFCGEEPSTCRSQAKLTKAERAGNCTEGAETSSGEDKTDPEARRFKVATSEADSTQFESQVSPTQRIRPQRRPRKITEAEAENLLDIVRRLTGEKYPCRGIPWSQVVKEMPTSWTTTQLRLLFYGRLLPSLRASGCSTVPKKVLVRQTLRYLRRQKRRVSDLSEVVWGNIFPCMPTVVISTAVKALFHEHFPPPTQVPFYMQVKELYKLLCCEEFVEQDYETLLSLTQPGESKPSIKRAERLLNQCREPVHPLPTAESSASANATLPLQTDDGNSNGGVHRRPKKIRLEDE